MADIPHFRVPLEFVGNALAVVEQDTEVEVEQCIEAVLRYPKGTRLTSPNFGIADPSFRQVPTSAGIDATDIVAAVLEFEPRARDVLMTMSTVSIVDAIMGVAMRIRLTEGASGG